MSGLKRKFRPKHSLIQVNRKGKIEAIYKFKRIPTEEQQIEALNKHPGTVQIPAMADTYRNEAELKGGINKSMRLFDKMKKRQ